MWRMGLWTQWGRERVGEWGSGLSIQTLPGVRQTAGEKLLCSTGSPVWPSVMTQMLGWGRGREAPEGGVICVITADSRYCMAETNTTV